MSYPNNDREVAVVASDSGKATRTDLRNVDIVNNFLNGEVMKGCELADEIVYCENNDR